MKDQDIRITAEQPEAEVQHIVRGIVRRGLKPVPAKTSVSLRTDADVLEWFKAQGPLGTAARHRRAEDADQRGLALLASCRRP